MHGQPCALASELSDGSLCGLYENPWAEREAQRESTVFVQHPLKANLEISSRGEWESSFRSIDEKQ